MNKSRLLVGLLLVALVALFAPASHAANCQAGATTINCNVIAVGSSAIFPSAAIAAVSGDSQIGQPPLCGSGGVPPHMWVGSASGRDARKTLTTPNIPDEGGTVWISWDNDTAPTIICAYLSVDSIVGQRLFYGQGSGASSVTNNAQLILRDVPTFGSGAACNAASSHGVSFVWDAGDAVSNPPLNVVGALPSQVYDALEGTTSTALNPCPVPVAPVNFTTASTDVRPEDAKFVGNDRVLGFDANGTAGYPPDDKSALGYGSYSGTALNCLVPGVAISGSYVSSTGSTPSAQSICYDFVAGDLDPISGTAILPSTVSSEAALSLIPFISITDTNSGGFGDLYTNRGFNDVLSHDIAAGYAFSGAGTATLTRDLYTGSQDPSAPTIPIVVAHYLAREPQSGTYTTFEWQVIRQKDGYLGGSTLSQETNVCGPSQGGSCPYNATGSAPCPALPGFAAKSFPSAFQCSNYMSWGTSGSFEALKTRVIGTGQMVSVSNTDGTSTCAGFPAFPCITDTFGYAFWSLGSFGNKTAIRYLELDSNDGLFPGWSTTDSGHNGVFPGGVSGQGSVSNTGAPAAGQCGGYFNGTVPPGGPPGSISTFGCNAYGLPTFDNVISGNYRAWNINRIVYYASVPDGESNSVPRWGTNATTGLNPPAFWLSAADQAAPPFPAKIPDFVPFGYCANAAACPNGSAPTLTFPLHAIRSHYAAAAWPAALKPPNNGIVSPGPPIFGIGTELGGDVAGGAITVTAEYDSVRFFSGSFLSWIQ